MIQKLFLAKTPSEKITTDQCPEELDPNIQILAEVDEE